MLSNLYLGVLESPYSGGNNGSSDIRQIVHLCRAGNDSVGGKEFQSGV